MKTCCFCFRKYTGEGNNALPIMKRRCCDTCNIHLVVPIRMARIIRLKEMENDKK